MEIPEYVSKEEVRRVCAELNFQDWTMVTESDVTLEEAKIIIAEVNVNNMDIDPEEFRRGLQVELEHGTMYEEANVTNNHPILTGKIVLAHLNETLDYYQRLEVAETEGDLLKAIAGGDVEKIRSKYKKLAVTSRILNRTIEEQL